MNANDDDDDYNDNDDDDGVVCCVCFSYCCVQPDMFHDTHTFTLFIFHIYAAASIIYHGQITIINIIDTMANTDNNNE